MNDTTDIQIIEGEALEIMTRAEMNSQVDIANRYPRMTSACLDTARSMATTNAEIASSCFYSLPRGKGRDAKNIEGPSIRFAEIIAYAWKNIRVLSRITEVGARHVTAQAVCFDAENNRAESAEVRRNIVTSKGHRYGDDMIRVTCQAATAIARRNAIFAVIPRAIWEPVYQEARRAALGEGTLEEKRAKTLEWYARRGYEVDQVCELVQVRSAEDLDLDKLLMLRGLCTAVAEGVTTLKEMFKGTGGEEAVPLQARLADAMRNKDAEPEPDANPAAEPPPESPQEPSSAAEPEPAPSQPDEPEAQAQPEQPADEPESETPEPESLGEMLGGGAEEHNGVQYDPETGEVIDPGPPAGEDGY